MFYLNFKKIYLIYFLNIFLYLEGTRKIYEKIFSLQAPRKKNKTPATLKIYIIIFISYKTIFYIDRKSNIRANEDVE